MKKVFIIHGFTGIPNGGWLPWLMHQFGKDLTFACSLPMPNPSEPVVSLWVDAMKSYIGEPNEEIYLVGHSLGVPAIYHYLKSLPGDTRIGGAVLVSGLIKPIHEDDPNSAFRKIDSFVTPELDFKEVKNKSNKFVVIHGKQDDVVPFSHGEKISADLECEFIVVPLGDHFTQVKEPRTYELPQVYDALKSMLK